MTIPDPPEIDPLVPRLMSASELRQNLERVFDWLHMVEAAPDDEAPPHRLVQEVRDTANMLLSERRERHSDESAPRGG
jgi:hypothetical protein